MTSTFEQTFMALLSGRLNDTSIKIAWGAAEDGAPVRGVKEVVLFYAPGGERELDMDGVTDEQGRHIQVSIFSPDVQDVKDASKAIHAALDGYRGSLTDGTLIYNVIPRFQDIDSFDNSEKVHQTIFEYEVRMSESS